MRKIIKAEEALKTQDRYDAASHEENELKCNWLRGNIKFCILRLAERYYNDMLGLVEAQSTNPLNFSETCCQRILHHARS